MPLTKNCWLPSLPSATSGLLWRATSSSCGPTTNHCWWPFTDSLNPGHPGNRDSWLSLMSSQRCHLRTQCLQCRGRHAFPVTGRSGVPRGCRCSWTTTAWPLTSCCIWRWLPFVPIPACISARSTWTAVPSSVTSVLGLSGQ